MAKQFEFPTKLETDKWQMNFANIYCRLLKEKEVQADMMNDKSMLDKIENAENYAVLKRQQYESLTTYGKE